MTGAGAAILGDLAADPPQPTHAVLTVNEDDSPFRRTTREILAAAPAPEAERLRVAYLDLLKLCLCDLAGAGTTSVIWNAVDPVHSRELAGEELKRRVVGQDWPLHGLSMIGLERLDDLQSVIETVIAEGVPGDLIEAGSWRGGSTILMRATLDSLGADDRTVHVCDSFAGFPTQGDESFPEDPKLKGLSAIDFLSAELEDVEANFRRFGLSQGVEFVKGYFADTLPALPKRTYAVIRLDGDTYEPTWLGLEALYPQLAQGGYLIVDDYSFIDACRRAVDDFREQHGITEPIERIDWNAIRWRRESAPEEPGEKAQAPAEAPAERTRGRGTERAGSSPIPTQREVELDRELVASRGRVAELELAVEHLRRSPIAGPAAWARARLRRR